MKRHNTSLAGDVCSLVISSTLRPWRLSQTATTVTNARHSSMDSHSRAVDSISANVRGLYERKEKFRIFHGSTNSTRHASKGNKLVNTSSLSHVLEVDPERRIAKVEPNVSMDRLVEETLKYGLIPPVVMEFPGIPLVEDMQELRARAAHINMASSTAPSIPSKRSLPTAILLHAQKKRSLTSSTAQQVHAVPWA